MDFFRFEPRINWEVNQPAKLKSTLAVLETIQNNFNSAQEENKHISLADFIAAWNKVMKLDRSL